MQTRSKPQKRGTARAAKGRAGLSAQQTIPYIAMHPDGICQLPGGLYTKTLEYEDINYAAASTEDQTAITEARHALAADRVRSFLTDMERLGFEKEDLLSLLRQESEKE